MPRGHPENLKQFTHEERVENGRKGGKKSGEARREKRTVQTLLSQYMDSKCSDTAALKKLAAQLGMKSDESVKSLVVATCVINTIKNGSFKDLSMLQEILGEAEETNDESKVQVIIDV